MGVDFDGVDDFVEIQNANFLDSETDFTIACWFYLDEDPDVSDKYFVFLSDRMDSINSNFFQFTIDPVGRLVLQIHNGTSSYLEETNDLNISINTWHCVMGTGGSFGLKMYLDNVEITDLLTDETNQPSFGSSNGKKPRIGNFYNTASDKWFNGQIDEMAVWTVTLSQTEREMYCDSKIKGMPLQIQPASLKMYLPMDDGPDGTSADGDTVRDLSGNGNNGTGDDGANNTGLTWKAEEVLSYPAGIIPAILPAAIGLTLLDFERANMRGANRGIMRGVG